MTLAPILYSIGGGLVALCLNGLVHWLCSKLISDDGAPDYWGRGL